MFGETVEEDLRNYLLSQIGWRTHFGPSSRAGGMQSYSLYFFSEPQKYIAWAGSHSEDPDTGLEGSLLPLWPEKIKVPEWSLRLQSYVSAFPEAPARILREALQGKFMVEAREKVFFLCSISGQPNEEIFLQSLLKYPLMRRALLNLASEKESDYQADSEKVFHNLWEFQIHHNFGYFPITLSEDTLSGITFRPHLVSPLQWRLLNKDVQIVLWHTILNYLFPFLTSGAIESGLCMDSRQFRFGRGYLPSYPADQLALFWSSEERCPFLLHMLLNVVQWISGEESEIYLDFWCEEEETLFTEVPLYAEKLASLICEVLDHVPEKICADDAVDKTMTNLVFHYRD